MNPGKLLFDQGPLVGNMRMRLDMAASPLAYNLHRGKWHDAVAILDQVNARNRTEAKAKWQAALKYFDDD